MEKILIESANELVKMLTNFTEKGAKGIKEYLINCSDLSENFLFQDIRYSTEYKQIFDELKEFENSPCIYSFEILSEISADQIVELIGAFSQDPNCSKVIPAIKPHFSKDTKTLYVGKVNNNICGRLITHLGFHTQVKKGIRTPSNNHGLQLCYWATDISLKFKVIQFEPEMKNVLETLETELANRLKPIIGKHR